MSRVSVKIRKVSDSCFRRLLSYEHFFEHISETVFVSL